MTYPLSLFRERQALLLDDEGLHAAVPAAGDTNGSIGSVVLPVGDFQVGQSTLARRKGARVQRLKGPSKSSRASLSKGPRVHLSGVGLGAVARVFAASAMLPPHCG